MRQGTSQNVNRVCKQPRSWSAADSGYVSASGSSYAASHLTPRTRASSPLPAFPFKNSPVTPQFFIQANIPTRLRFFGSFLAAGRPRAGCPRFLADFENIKWRGKIENFSAGLLRVEAGHAG